ncbi:MAG: transposase [Candidatus Omnitrophota bacterium]
MPNGPRPLVEGACYHIIARGNNRQVIFRSPKDYEKYISLIKHYKRKYKFRVFCYCLMPNHLHLVIDLQEVKKISNVMSSLQRAYTGYFNTKYRTVGHLWQGRFKSKIILKDNYLVRCINYIELDPIRSDIVKSPEEYRWSSYAARTVNEESEECGILDEIDVL